MTAGLVASELRRIQRELTDLPVGLSSGVDEVSFVVVYDDGSIQAWLDEEYGEGQVRISSALMPV